MRSIEFSSSLWNLLSLCELIISTVVFLSVPISVPIGEFPTILRCIPMLGKPLWKLVTVLEALCSLVPLQLWTRILGLQSGILITD